jgi:hypothetical protein
MIWNLLANISLLLFTASVAMWVRSYTIGDRYVGWSRYDNTDGASLVATSFSCGHGQLSLERIKIQFAHGGALNGFSIQGMSSLIQRDAGWQHQGSAVGVELPTIFRRMGGGTQVWQLGFPHYMSHTTSYGAAGSWGGRALTLPLWVLSAVTGILPVFKLKSALATRLRDVRSRRWRRRGLCGCCGFDIRFSPERCPECGAVPHS